MWQRQFLREERLVYFMSLGTDGRRRDAANRSVIPGQRWRRNGRNLTDTILVSTGRFVAVSHLQTEQPDGSRACFRLLGRVDFTPRDRRSFTSWWSLIVACSHSAATLLKVKCLFQFVYLRTDLPTHAMSQRSIFRLRPKELLQCVGIFLLVLFERCSWLPGWLMLFVCSSQKVAGGQFDAVAGPHD